MKILVACEETQAVTKAFRLLGHEAFSCDIQFCSGGHPEWHIRKSVLDVINEGWDVLIAFPPCTHLASSGAKHFSAKKESGQQSAAIDFFMRMVNADIKHICVENPIGIMSNLYKKPTQIIQPYFFGDKERKSTCLWLKNLPALYSNRTPDLFNDTASHVEPEFIKSSTGNLYTKTHWLGGSNGAGKIKSKTYPGIASAMANQWTEYLNI